MRILLTIAIFASMLGIVHYADGALSLGATTSTGYQCEIRPGGGSCTCDPLVGPKDPATCKGMDEECHRRGADVDCIIDLHTGQEQCTCKWGARVVTGTSIFATSYTAFQ